MLRRQQPILDKANDLFRDDSLQQQPQLRPKPSNLTPYLAEIEVVVTPFSVAKNSALIYNAPRGMFIRAPPSPSGSKTAASLPSRRNFSIKGTPSRKLSILDRHSSLSPKSNGEPSPSTDIRRLNSPRPSRAKTPPHLITSSTSSTQRYARKSN
jgi:hypothetical protein